MASGREGCRYHNQLINFVVDGCDLRPFRGRRNPPFRTRSLATKIMFHNNLTNLP